MRTLVSSVLCVLVALTGVARAAGFDHLFHDRNLVVSGKDKLACSSCHTESGGRLVGKPGHAACFGACHGAAPATPRKGTKLAFGDRGQVCAACHGETVNGTTFTGKVTVPYPPYTLEPEHNISFGHKQHQTIDCAQCHDMRVKPAARITHARCLGCHDGTTAAGHGPPMQQCLSCHPEAYGKPEPPSLAALRDTVGTTFSHPKHAARGPAGKECVTCHLAIKATDDTQLPRPVMQSCASATCHDGKAAFATTDACTRCHDQAPSEYEVHRPRERFTHAGNHASVVSERPCGGCHALGPRGDTLVASHSACVQCHANGFAERKPTICGACHNGSEPWRKLVADRLPAERTEFGATLDHDKHPQACTTCHNLRTAGAQLRPPRGHASCVGSGCHAAKTGPVPTLETCSGCHRANLAADRATARERAPWSVRAQFQHDTHGEDCQTCHTRLSGDDLMQLATPAKSTCITCHDAGKSAFKVTGTTCGRCHGTGSG